MTGLGRWKAGSTGRRGAKAVGLCNDEPRGFADKSRAGAASCILGPRGFADGRNVLLSIVGRASCILVILGEGSLFESACATLDKYEEL